jgi:hypothetical protein
MRRCAVDERYRWLIADRAVRPDLIVVAREERGSGRDGLIGLVALRRDGGADYSQL